MNVIVTFAVRSELAPWLRLRTFRRREVNGWTSYETTIAGTAVHAVLTGIGPSHAKKAIRAALRSRPDAVLASGLAGALKPCFGVGDVLAARLVHFDGTDQHVSSSEDLLDLAIDCGAKAVDSFISRNAIARTAGEKAVLGSLADAVDMESFAILTEARRSGVPAIALRSIADTSECDLPCDFSKMVDERGQIRLWRVALEPICAPQRVPALIRFALASHRAASRLARFLDRYLEVLAETRGHWQLAQVRRI
jgi:nucleoside phosphorylase